MNQFSEISNMSEEELKVELEKSLTELHKFRMENRLKKLKETHKIRLIKKRIAQIKTAKKQFKKTSPIEKKVEKKREILEELPPEEKEVKSKKSKKKEEK